MEEADGFRDDSLGGATQITGGVIFGQANNDDDGITPGTDTGAVNLIELIGDIDTGVLDTTPTINEANLTFDLDLGSVDIIGIGATAAGDGEQRTTAGIVFNGGTDNSREAGDVTGAFNDNADDDQLTINTTSDDIRLNGSVRLDSDVRIDTDETALTSTGGADILFTNDAFVDSQGDTTNGSEGNDLVLDAGIASVFFNENIGAGTDGELGQLIVEEADTSVVFGQSTATGEDDDNGVSPNTGGITDAQDRGAVNSIVIIGDIGTTPAGETLAEASEDLDIGRDDIITSIVLNGGNDNSRSADTGSALNNTNDDTLTITTNADDVRFNGAVTFSSDVRIDVDAVFADTLTAGATAGDSMVTVTDASGLTVGDRILIGSSGTGGNGELQTIGAINFTTNEITLLGTLGNNQSSGAQLLLAGANVLFTNDTSIDSQASEGNDLVIDAGTQSVFFNEDIGAATATSQLGQLIVEEADGLDDAGSPTGGVVFGQADDDDNGAMPTVDGGVVNVVNLIGDIDAGSETSEDVNLGSLDIIGIGFDDGNVRNGAGIVFNGGNSNSQSTDVSDTLNNTNDDTLLIATSSDDVRFNGSVRLDSDVRIDTDQTTLTSTGGADILFTNDAFIDSQATEGNDLVLDAGIASVLFNENIGGAGAANALGEVVVEEADAGIIFGQSDTETGVDEGQVETINVRTGLLLGSLDFVTGGITLNGGGSGNLTIESQDVSAKPSTAMLKESDSNDVLTATGRVLFTAVSTQAFTDTSINIVFRNDVVGDSDTSVTVTGNGTGRDVTVTVELGDDGNMITATPSDIVRAFRNDSVASSLIAVERTGLDTPFNDAVMIQTAAADTGFTGLSIASVTIERAKIILNGPVEIQSNLTVESPAANTSLLLTGNATLNSEAGRAFADALTASATAGGSTLTVTNATGLTAGDRILIGTGNTGELQTISAIDFTMNEITLQDVLANNQIAGARVVLVAFDVTIDGQDGDLAFLGSVGQSVMPNNFTVNAGGSVTILSPFDIAGNLTSTGSGHFVGTADVTVAGDTINVTADGDIGFSRLETRAADGLITLTSIRGGIFDGDQLDGTDDADLIASRIALRSAEGIGDDANTIATSLVSAAPAGSNTITVTSDLSGVTVGAEVTIVDDDSAAQSFRVTAVNTLTRTLTLSNPLSDNFDPASNAIVTIEPGDPALAVNAADMPTAGNPMVRSSAIDTETSTIAARNAVSGDIQIVNDLPTGASPADELLTIGTVDGLSGVSNEGDNNEIVWITNQSPILVGTMTAPNASRSDLVTTVTAANVGNQTGAVIEETPDARATRESEGVFNRAGGSIILTAANTTTADTVVLNAPVEASEGRGSVLINAGGALTINSRIITAIDPTLTAVELQSRFGNIDLNAGGTITINNDGFSPFAVQTGTLVNFVDPTSADPTNEVAPDQSNTDTLFQRDPDGTLVRDAEGRPIRIPNRQIRYTTGDGRSIILNDTRLATNIQQMDNASLGTINDPRINPATTPQTQLDLSSPFQPGITFLDLDGDGTFETPTSTTVAGDTTALLDNSGVLVDSGFDAGNAPDGLTDERVFAPDGSPLLARETFVAPDVTSSGLATITGRFARPGEVNYRILVAWGDDTFSYQHVTGAVTAADTDDPSVNRGDAVRAPGTFSSDPLVDDGLFGEDIEPLVTATPTARTFQFEHFFDPRNLPNPENAADPILIRVLVQADPNIVAVDGNDIILDPSPPGDANTNQPQPNEPLIQARELIEPADPNELDDPSQDLADNLELIPTAPENNGAPGVEQGDQFVINPADQSRLPIDGNSLIRSNTLNRQFLLNEVFATTLAEAATQQQVEQFAVKDFNDVDMDNDVNEPLRDFNDVDMDGDTDELVSTPLGTVGTGLGARIDTLRGPDAPGALITDLGIGAAEIFRPASIGQSLESTGENLRFNMLEVLSPLNQNEVSQPTLVDFEFEQLVTGEAILSLSNASASEAARAGESGFATSAVAADIVNQSIVEVPPITASVAAIFEFKSEVPALAFPESTSTIETFAIGEGVQQDEIGVSVLTTQAEGQQTEERVVVLRVLRPTGLTVASKLIDPMQLLDELTKLVAGRFRVDEERVSLRVNSFGGFDGEIAGEPGKEDEVRQLELKRNSSGGYDIEIITATVDLKEDVLDDLPRRVFQRLPDGRYGIFLREAGQDELRRIMEVIIRDGRPADDKSNDKKGAEADDGPAGEEQGPGNESANSSEATELQNGRANAAIDGASTGIKPARLNAPTERTTAAAEFGPSGQEPFDAAWAAWGQTSEESLSGPAQTMNAIGASIDGDEVASTEQAAEGTSHPLATSALLAGGAILAKLRQGRWKDRVDETMERWEEDRQEKGDSKRRPR